MAQLQVREERSATGLLEDRVRCRWQAQQFTSPPTLVSTMEGNGRKSLLHESGFIKHRQRYSSKRRMAQATSEINSDNRSSAEACSPSSTLKAVESMDSTK